MTNNDKKQPIQKTKFGNIEVTLWENHNSEGELFHSFNLKRSYKDKEDNWQEQNVSLSRNDVLKAAAALAQANVDFYSLSQQTARDSEQQESSQAR